jgi:hypothetical protein
VSAELGGLRAPDGVHGCMGNHDYFTDGEHFARALAGHGLSLLRNRGQVIERDGGCLYLAGVDDTWTHRHDLDRALADKPEGAPVVLLAHDPALFPAAASRGVALTLSGHTHGGQLAVPLAPRRWNLARFLTPFTAGLYRIGDNVLYVNRGLGTTGPPIRLAVRPEITLFTLVPADPVEGERIHGWPRTSSATPATPKGSSGGGSRRRPPRARGLSPRGEAPGEIAADEATEARRITAPSAAPDGLAHLSPRGEVAASARRVRGGRSSSIPRRRCSRESAAVPDPGRYPGLRFCAVPGARKRLRCDPAGAAARAI